MIRGTFSRRLFVLWATVALLVVGLTGTALAVAAETPTESPSSGWVEQDTSTADSDSSSSEVQRGSSLGTGTGAAPDPEPEPERVEYSPPPAPQPTPPEPSGAEAASTTETAGEVTTASKAVAPPAVAEQPERKPLAGGTDPVGAAVLGVASEPNLTPLVATPTSSGDAAGGSAFGSSAVVLLVVLALLLAGLLGWFGLRHLHQRHRWRRETAEWAAAAAEWEAAVRRPEPERQQLTVRRVSNDARPGSPNGAPSTKIH